MDPVHAGQPVLAGGWPAPDPSRPVPGQFTTRGQWGAGRLGTPLGAGFRSTGHEQSSVAGQAHQATVLTDLAGAYGRSGEPEAACTVAGQALDIIAGNRSGATLARLRGTLEPWPDIRPVRELSARVRALGETG